MAIIFRNTKGSPLSHVEMDTNFATLYVSSSISSGILSLFSEGSGSTPTAITHSIPLPGHEIAALAHVSAQGSWLTVDGNPDNSAELYSDRVLLANSTLITSTTTDADTVTITHNSVSRTNTTSVTSPSHGGTFTVVDGITSSAEGHITEVNTKTVTLPDIYSFSVKGDNAGTKTISSGDTLSLLATGPISTLSSDTDTITITHDSVTRTDTTDTQTATAEGTIAIVDSVTSSAEGHITAVNVKTVTLPADTTYGVSAVSNGKIRLTGSDSTTDDVTIAGGTGINIGTAGDTITISATSLSLTSVFTAANEAAQLALTTQEGDVVVRTDESKTYMRSSGAAGTMADFILLETPFDTVSSLTTHTGLSSNVSATGDVTITNTGVTALTTNTGLSSNVSATGAVTITNTDAGSSQNIFKNIAVAGQTTVTSEINDDTLTLVGGTNVTITTDDSTDTITIASEDTTYSVATDNALGLIELFSDTDQSVAANTVSTTSSRTYGLQLNSANQGVINVPWTDTTYSVATDTALGLVELFSNTDQSVAANAVTATASRTYGLQLNSANQGVINVPWTDTDTGFGTLQQTTTLGNTTTDSAHFGTGSALSNSGLSVHGGWASFASNVQGTAPPVATGVHIGWNRSAGTQESEILFGGLEADGHKSLYITSRGASNAEKVAMAFKTTGIFAGAASTGYYSITAANFITTSDRRLKSDIEPIKDGLSVLKQFTSYEYIKDDKQDAGFIAQEVQEVIPYSVMEDDQGYLTMNDRPILAHMHKAILELEVRLKAIEEKLK